jgi:Flp pilus assembly protein TadD
MISNFAPQGALGETLFPELAREVNQRKLTGGLRLTCGQVKKIVYFDSGEIYAAVSNLAQDTVLALLQRSGRLDPAQADEIKQQVSAGRPLSEALVERGIARESLARLRAEQVAAIVGSLCDWEQGEYQFEEGARVEGSALGIATSDLILDGARGLSTAKALWRVVGDPRTKIKLASGTEARFAQLNLKPQEAFLLTRLDMPIEVGELLTISGFSEEETLRSVYALYCAGLISRTGYTAALKVAAQAPPTAPAATPAPAQPQMDQTERQEIIRMARLVTESNDDYEILGLTPQTTQAEVKRTYHRLAKKYHPDRHQQDADAETIACLTSIFARVKQAYEAVKDRAPLSAAAASETAHYQETPPDAAAMPSPPPPTVKTSTPTPPDAAPPSPVEAPANGESAAAEDDVYESSQNDPQLAEINFQEAMVRYQNGDLVGATELFSEAARLDPGNAHYHAQLGIMLGYNPRRRKQAETHLLRAIELDQQNQTYYMHLGALYKTLGFFARAEKQFGIALNLDPLNKVAMKELRAVRAMKQAKEEEADSNNAKTKESAAANLFSKLFKRK